MSKNIESLTNDEQVLFDALEAIAGAWRIGGVQIGHDGAQDAIRRMQNMGLVIRRKHERRPPESDLSFLQGSANGGCRSDSPC